MLRRDGDREPLLQGLPPLLFCETGSNGVEEKDGSFGFMNKHEAQLVSEIIKSLIAHGISCSRVGVIAFYKAQVRCDVLVFIYLHENHLTMRQADEVWIYDAIT